MSSTSTPGDTQPQWIAAESALTPDGKLNGPVWISQRDGRIADVRWGEAPPDAPEPSGVLSPGLIDLQCNGGLGLTLGRTEPQQWEPWRSWLPQGGVTSVAPTLTSGPFDTLLAQIEATYRYAARHRGSAATGARLLGVHLEGPFLSPVRLGAHKARWRRDPTATHVDALAGLPAGSLAICTLAPELPGADPLIAALCQAGVVVSIGHSNATAEETHRAADAGASMVTHLGNAQRGLHHREPGVVGAALVDDRLTLGLIGDLTHIHAEFLELARRAAPGRCLLVTDAVAQAGIDAEAPRVPSQHAFVADEAATAEVGSDDTVLAGGVRTGAQVVAGLVAAGFDAGWVLNAFTRTPAQLLGRDDLGTLEVGGLADLVRWSPDWTVTETWIGGALAFSGDANPAPAAPTATTPGRPSAEEMARWPAPVAPEPAHPQPGEDDAWETAFDTG